MNELTNFMTWDAISTYSGAILCVTLITQFIKGLGFIGKIPTRVTAYAVAVIVMNLALVFTGGFTISAFMLNFINAVIVSLAANGTYDACNRAGYTLGKGSADK